MKVYVVSFAPFQERAAVGGFEWRYRREDAEAFYEAEAKRSDADNYMLRLLEIEVEARDTNAITDELDSRIEDLEVNLPTLRQRVPAVSA